MGAPEPNLQQCSQIPHNVLQQQSLSTNLLFTYKITALLLEDYFSPLAPENKKKTKTLSINKLFSDILQKIQKALTALLVLLQSLHALVSVEPVVHWMVGQSSSFIKETETRKIPLTKTMLVTYTENIYVICKCNTKSQVSILERGKT